jgi:3-hydroxyacyl-[acyl-carrier-protein] dehydratase
MHVSLIDRIVSLQPGEIRAAKCLSFREGFLGDHFASFPLMPGALQCEAMVQAAQWMLREKLGFPEADFLPVAFSNTRYARYVRPGEQITFTVKLQSEEGGRWRFKGVGEVDGERACQAQFELVKYDASWREGVSIETRAELIRKQRDTFARLGRVPPPYATNGHGPESGRLA